MTFTPSLPILPKERKSKRYRQESDVKRTLNAFIISYDYTRLVNCSNDIRHTSTHPSLIGKAVVYLIGSIANVEVTFDSPFTLLTIRL